MSGIAELNRLLRNDSEKLGTPLPLSKSPGIGVLNSSHEATGRPIAGEIPGTAHTIANNL